MGAEKRFKLHITWKTAVLLAVQLALIVWGVTGLAAGERVIYDREQIEGGTLEFKPGVYRAALRYEAKTDDKNKLAVTYGGFPYKGLLSNEVPLYAGELEAESVFWVSAHLQDVQIGAVNGEENREDFQVLDLTVYRTNLGSRLYLFFVILLCLLVDGAVIFYQYDRQVGVSARSKLVICGLAGTVVIASVPLLTDYVLAGHDVGFHLLRIEGLYEGWQAGYFPVRIQPGWMKGHGYASSVFYADTFLTVPALLRLIGFPVMTAYKSYVLLVNTATVLVSYFSLKGIFGSRRTALLGCALYSLNAYRLYDLYVSATVGEYTAMIFLPLLCYGFYRIYTLETEVGRRGAWLPVSVGLSGIVQCHVLSSEMTAIFIGALCLTLWKKTLRRRIFLELAKAAVFTVLFCTWFIVPFLDYMLTGDFYVMHALGRLIQAWGLYPAHLARVFYNGGNSVTLDLNGMVATGAYSLGPALMAGYGFCIWRRGAAPCGRVGKEQLKLGRVAFGIGTAALLMSLVLFPWDSLQRANGLLNSMFSALQFPNRLLSIAAVAVTLAVCVTAHGLFGQEDRMLRGVFLTVVAGLCLISALYQTNAMLYQHPLYRIYTAESMGNTYVGGAEYLLIETAQYSVAYDRGTPGPGTEIKGFSKDKYGLRTRVSCVNTLAEESYVELPVFAYKGFRAWDEETGERLEVSVGSNGNVRVRLPAGYEGALTADFVSPWYWRAAEAVTAFTVPGLALGGVIAARRGKKTAADGRKR